MFEKVLNTDLLRAWCAYIGYAMFSSISFISFEIYYKSIRTLLKTSNYGQNIINKFTKFSKINVSLECFIADFLQFSSTNIEIWHKIKGYIRNVHMGRTLLKLPKTKPTKTSLIAKVLKEHLHGMKIKLNTIQQEPNDCFLRK